MRVRLASIVLAAAFAGCGGPRGLVETPRGAIIDGWPVGERVDCASFDDCETLLQVAVDGMTTRDVVLWNVASVTLHQYRQDQDGIFRSGGPPEIAVFTMGDGSLRAIGVKRYPVGPPRVIDFGP